MSLCTVPAGFLNTIHPPCQTGLSFDGGPCCCFDAGSHFQAKIAFVRQSDAARTPGTSCPQYVANDPITGPSIVPRFVPAASQPSDRARCSGGTVSPMYALRTPV